MTQYMVTDERHRHAVVAAGNVAIKMNNDSRDELGEVMEAFSALYGKVTDDLEREVGNVERLPQAKAAATGAPAKASAPVGAKNVAHSSEDEWEEL